MITGTKSLNTHQVLSGPSGLSQASLQIGQVWAFCGREIAQVVSKPLIFDISAHYPCL